MSHLKAEENPQSDLRVITLVKLLCPHCAAGGVRGEKCLLGGFQAYRTGLEKIFLSMVDSLLCFHMTGAASHSPGDPESMPKTC